MNQPKLPYVAMVCVLPDSYKVDQSEIEDIFNNKIWSRLVINKHSSEHPTGFVLGGQPAAGKSSLTKRLQNTVFKNCGAIEINGDEFRTYHPKINEIFNKFGKDYPKYTADFAGAITELAIKRAIKEKYNIITEGTFRTSKTPLKTLQDFKDSNYRTGVAIIAVDANVSWKSTIERFEKMGNVHQYGRAVPKEHHDLVVANLSQNALTVAQSGKADVLMVFNREKLLWHSQQNDNVFSIQEAIEKELYQLNDKHCEALNLMRSKIRENFSDQPTELKTKLELLSQKIPDLASGKIKLPSMEVEKHKKPKER